jgi:hypothetical protein
MREEHSGWFIHAPPQTIAINILWDSKLFAGCQTHVECRGLSSVANVSKYDEKSKIFDELSN